MLSNAFFFVAVVQGRAGEDSVDNWQGQSELNGGGLGIWNRRVVPCGSRYMVQPNAFRGTVSYSFAGKCVIIGGRPTVPIHGLEEMLSQEVQLVAVGPHHLSGSASNWSDNN